MAGRPNVSTGALPSTYGVGAWGAQGSSKNYRRPMGKDAGRQHNSARFDHPTGRTTGGNSYGGGFRPGDGNLYPERARAVRSAGYGQGRLQPSPAGQWRPNAPFHTGTPANLQRPAFDNWSAKKASCQGEMGHKSAIVYWGDLRERDEKMRAMRIKYPLNEERRELIREAFYKLDRDGDGLVTLQDIKNNGYNAKTHPRYLAQPPNHWTEDQVFMNVIARFKLGEYEKGTTQKFSSINLDEFEEYYRVVGEDLDDEYFGAMIAQAWRLQRRNPGGQGWDQQVLSHLALVEANMMGDGYLGQEALNRDKLAAIAISDSDKDKLTKWKKMVDSGEYLQMQKAAEELESYVEKHEVLDQFPHAVAANAVRLFRSGGAAIMTKLACAQDPLIKRTCANALFLALKDELPRLELAEDGNARGRLIREGLPSIAQGSDIVARNKVERVKAVLL
mmetsp:Transcript_87831/g.128464  ORF Transcript_87831/g.128464 Transcript_87831/m.128464 type:complete len:447 (+) Transcript_87831:92-1432(+)|eukprot:CAMPEP_0179438100 /NCGR_PEP_ID=MMETSP0799-20121207/21887_1 /TAXON_ID=46947 /ORGANISM="Geminigera cryophila, Strain CCMP2564" /LENGTH=446 /DNA_ID=CAMNT_0021219487 /DNA_START=92 /DNA_END=1432 /DNA_ORIENTATION=+